MNSQVLQTIHRINPLLGTQVSEILHLFSKVPGVEIVDTGYRLRGIYVCFKFGEGLERKTYEFTIQERLPEPPAVA